MWITRAAVPGGSTVWNFVEPLGADIVDLLVAVEQCSDVGHGIGVGELRVVVGVFLRCLQLGIDHRVLFSLELLEQRPEL